MDTIAVVVSELDLAGMTIKRCLITQGFEKTEETFEGTAVYTFRNTKLYTLKNDSIYADHLDEAIDADLIIFATKHQSSQGVRSLSVHAPGNWGAADMGGKAGRLCIAPASSLKAGLRALADLAQGIDCEITVESTHHGPFLETPCMFIEIGSSPEQWNDLGLGTIIAQAIIRLLDDSTNHPTAVLLGGGHYNHEANKLLLHSDHAIGHICPKHMLPLLTPGMLDQAISRTRAKASLVILDWKGLGTEKSRILAMLTDLGLPFDRSKRIEKEEITDNA